MGVLDRLLPVAERQQRPSLIIEIHLLRALAFDKCGHRDQAMTSLVQGLELAEPEGYTRPFVDMGKPLRLSDDIGRDAAVAACAWALVQLRDTPESAGGDAG